MKTLFCAFALLTTVFAQDAKVDPKATPPPTGLPKAMTTDQREMAYKAVVKVQKVQVELLTAQAALDPQKFQDYRKAQANMDAEWQAFIKVQESLRKEVGACENAQMNLDLTWTCPPPEKAK